MLIVRLYPFPVIPGLGKIEWFPYWIGLAGRYLFDLAALATGRQFPLSSIRIKKF